MSDNAMIIVATISMIQAVLLAGIGALVAWIQWKTKASVERAGSTAGRYAKRAAGKARQVAIKVQQVADDAIKTSSKVEEVKTALHDDRVREDGRMDRATARVEEVVGAMTEERRVSDAKLDALTEGKRVTHDKLNALAIVADTTHGLVNSGYTKQLEMVAELSRWKATQTKDPLHIKEAEDAERLLAEHITKQV